MKKTINTLFVIGLLVVLFSSVGSAYAMSDAGKGSGSGGKGKASSGTGIATSTTAVTGELSEEEKADLVFMREEEKLARDVYLTLYNIWGMDIFNNIAASEQTHTNSVNALLTAYGIPDPVVNDTIGVFVNSDLQILYDQLVATGSVSLVDALKVGAAIEEIDILDLYEAIAQTDEANIQQVYAQLLAGSENHLRGFVSVLESQTGEAYTPQYLSVESYQAIIAGSNAQQGSSQGQGGNRGGGGGRR
jgi:hypothetical protein